MSCFGPVNIGKLVAKLPAGFLCDKGYEVIKKFLPALLANQYKLTCIGASEIRDKASLKKFLQPETVQQVADDTRNVFAIALATREEEEACGRSENAADLDLEEIINESFFFFGTV